MRADADPEEAWRRISRSRAPLATLLMDQSVIAGLGNVFRAETLFRCRIPPLLPGRELGRERFDALWVDLTDMLRAGEREGRIETVRGPSGDQPDGGRGTDPGNSSCASAVYTYRRTGCPCLVCGAPIARATHAARNLFWCPCCQA